MTVQPLSRWDESARRSARSMRRSARSVRRSVGERSIDPMRGARNVEGRRGVSWEQGEEHV